jgi:hypothetical protein
MGVKQQQASEFDILIWWKVNAPKYSIFAAIARDVLVIPISTIASEFAFNTGGRVLDSFRSSLSPLTVEALICTQNWIRNNPIDIRGLEDYSISCGVLKTEVIELGQIGLSRGVLTEVIEPGRTGSSQGVLTERSRADRLKLRLDLGASGFGVDYFPNTHKM